MAISERFTSFIVSESLMSSLNATQKTDQGVNQLKHILLLSFKMSE